MGLLGVLDLEFKATGFLGVGFGIQGYWILGCWIWISRISGTALVLDEIINHVQSLQRQVEYLSMRLAAVNPRADFNLDSLICGNESVMDYSFQNTGMPIMWPEIQANGEDRQQLQEQWHFESLNQQVWVKEENHRKLVTSENSLLTYDSSATSASLHSRHQLKMEL